jgi:hypothetical protein
LAVERIDVREELAEAAVEPAQGDEPAVATPDLEAQIARL